MDVDEHEPWPPEDGGVEWHLQDTYRPVRPRVATTYLQPMAAVWIESSAVDGRGIRRSRRRPVPVSIGGAAIAIRLEVGDEVLQLALHHVAETSRLSVVRNTSEVS